MISLVRLVALAPPFILTEVVFVYGWLDFNVETYPALAGSFATYAALDTELAVYPAIESDIRFNP